MRVLVIKHVESEGPGTLGNFLRAIPARIHTLDLHKGDVLPENIEQYQAVVSMGGPMNVYEEKNYPFLKEETAFLRKVIDRGIPVLGICLGAQMIAKACGARIGRAAKKEVGWSSVRLTSEGSRDPLFRGSPEELIVMQWHEDTFELPKGGKLLAFSEECPHQAFRVNSAYGLQFHIEVHGYMLSRWFSNTDMWPGIIDRYLKVKKDLHLQAEKLYTNFFSLAGWEGIAPPGWNSPN